MSGRKKWLKPGYVSGEVVVVIRSRPEKTRSQDDAFVKNCSLDGLGERLPLRWSTPAGTPPSPKKNYRSNYKYLGWEELEDPASWRTLSEFDLLLRLVDFSGLRDMLAHLLGWISAKGQVPFDPISLFLLHGWQIANGWSRAETLRNLRNPRYGDYAQFFGFQEGVFPSEGGLRHFLTTLGFNSEAAGETVTVEQGEQFIEVATQQLNQLIAQSVQLIRAAGVLSENAWQQALICPDGQIHEAASRMRCQNVTDSCYRPAPRPCPAKAKEFRGCDCDTIDCAQVCKRATPQDPQARFVWYSGDNQDDDKDGEGFFGYRSLPLQLADPERRFSITLLDDFLPANQREEVPAAALLLQLANHYPDLNINTVAGDAGFGYEVVLHVIYDHLRARRVVAQRGHSSDQNQEQWPLRGYDDCGRPICPFGYSLVSNGYDYQRQRSKWVCQQACLKGSDPKVSLPEVCYPPPDCPYQHPSHLLGRIVNLGERFPDGSIRLVRDIPVGNPTWKALYHRSRNAVEARNATFETWGFKRLPVYGLPRSKALIFLADVLNNLVTLARLIREATLAHQNP
jgi:hypothetical protein